MQLFVTLLIILNLYRLGDLHHGDVLLGDPALTNFGAFDFWLYLGHSDLL